MWPPIVPSRIAGKLEPEINDSYVTDSRYFRRFMTTLEIFSNDPRWINLLTGRQSAVDWKGHAVNESGLVAGKKYERVSHILRRSQAPQRDFIKSLRAALRILKNRLQHRRVHSAGVD